MTCLHPYCDDTEAINTLSYGAGTGRVFYAPRNVTDSLIKIDSLNSSAKTACIEMKVNSDCSLGCR